RPPRAASGTAVLHRRLPWPARYGRTALSVYGASAPQSRAMGEDWTELVVTWPGGSFTVMLPPGARVETRSNTSATTDGAAFLASLTPTELRVPTELAHRPDTRPRLAVRLEISTSTLDNHLAAVKRKLLEHLVSAGQRPDDGYISTEMVIGWASRYIRE